MRARNYFLCHRIGSKGRNISVTHCDVAIYIAVNDGGREFRGWIPEIRAKVAFNGATAEDADGREVAQHTVVETFASTR